MQSLNAQLRVVIDLDGTICTQEKSGEYHLAKPIKKVVDDLKTLRMRGVYIIIYTARGMTTYRGNVNKVMEAYDRDTRLWLRENEVPYDELVFGKPAGDVYVDDKAVNVDDFEVTEQWPFGTGLVG